MPLDHYTAILRGELQPRFRIAARIPAGTSTDGANLLSVEELTKLHDGLAKPFNDLPNPEIPKYFPRGEISLLQLKAIIARRILKECTLCENRCGVDRTSGQRGKCRVGEKSYYASEFIHTGEEPEIVPSHTVFFTGCTFKCLYCQNWDIAHGSMASTDAGMPVDERLTEQIVRRAKSVRNLNLVGGNPDQHMAAIMEILVDLARLGYPRPVVWNSNNYMTEHAVDLLTGVADVHLADFKYGTNECGEELSEVKNYYDVITRNLMKEYKVAEILIRHLVLPGHVECCTKRIVEWVRDNIPNARFNLMFQYHPEFNADSHPVLCRYLTQEERERATELVREAGLDLAS